MIIGESVSGEAARYLAEEALIGEWFGALEPAVAAKYGSQLDPIVREGIKANHEVSQAMSMIMTSNFLEIPDTDDVTLDPRLSDIKREAHRGLSAMKALYRREHADEPTSSAPHNHGLGGVE